MSNAANTNSNPGQASTVTRAGKSVTYRNLQDRSCKRGSTIHPGAVALNQHAMVEPGKRIVLWGVDRNRVSGVRPYRIEFKVGDHAVYGSYNLTYTGKIVAIGEKTVTIEAYSGSSMAQRHRLSIYEFNWRNDDYDADKIAERNFAWCD